MTVSECIGRRVGPWGRLLAVALIGLLIGGDAISQGLIEDDAPYGQQALLSTPVSDPSDVQLALGSRGDGIDSEDAVRLVDYQHRLSRRIDRYVELDYLLMWAGDSTLPALLTTNPNGTPLGDVGLLGGPSTSVLYGNETVGSGAQGGFRLRLGRYFRRNWASRLELGLWMLLPDTETFGIRSTGGDPILARPFFNAAINAPDAQLLSYPGLVDGGFHSEYSRRAVGIDPLVFACLYGDKCNWLEFFSGYRFLWLKDELRLREEAIPEPGGLIAPGTRYVVTDRFRAENFYHLLPLGLSYSRNRGRWNINLRGDIGLGFVNKRVTISGQTDSYIGDNLIDSQSGGLLALGTNSGEHTTTHFAYVPQFNLSARYSLTDQLSAQVGYSLIYLDDAVKAVNHVPTTIDPGNLAPADPAAGPDPQFAFAFEDIVLHGFNFGLRLDY